MAVVPNADACEPVFSIDLASISGVENVEMKQLDTKFIQDSDLNALMDEVSADKLQKVQNPGAPVSLKDDAQSEVNAKKKRFVKLTDEEIDEIANFNTKSKTNKEAIGLRAQLSM